MYTIDKRFIDLLREEFHVILQSKTGWGRNELELAYERALSNALARWASENKS